MSTLTQVSYDDNGGAILVLDFRTAAVGTTVSTKHTVVLCTECGQPCIIKDSAKGRRFVHTAAITARRGKNSKWTVTGACFIPAVPKAR